MGARDVGPWVGEPKFLSKTPFMGNPGPDMTYLPTFFMRFISELSFNSTLT